MPGVSNSPLTDELREHLVSLSEALFPLADWVDTKFFDPQGLPEGSKLPWRNGKRLTPASIGAIEFFEALLATPDSDAALRSRWAHLANDPLQFSPLRDHGRWRADRGLEAKARFGAIESGNVTVAISEGGQTRAVSRATFYAPYWPLLLQAVRNAKPSNPPTWASFTAQLCGDVCPRWPTQPLKSSIFAKQLARDLLYAMLGMLNTVAEPWKTALLIELGERRRIGNQYTVASVDGAVAAFQQKMTEVVALANPPAPHS